MLSFSTSRNLWIFACLFLSFAGCERHSLPTQAARAADEAVELGMQADRIDGERKFTQPIESQMIPLESGK